MISAIGVVFLVSFWLLVYLIDRILSSKRFIIRYRKVLDKFGLTVSFLQIKSYTRYFNKWFQHIGKMHGSFMHIWFNLGITFGGVAMCSSVYMLFLMLFKNMTEDKPEQVLTPVIPGVNIPFRHLVYYFITLSVAGTLHEMGHAIAASRENVRVMGFGWFILPVFCGAYVELQTDHLQVISPIRQLRIYCAGVWHNFVSSLVAVGLWWSLPYFYLLLYSTQNGAVVSDVYKESAVSEKLSRGDRIIMINNCIVNSSTDYVHCIEETKKKPNQGYCHTVNAIQRRNTSNPYLAWNDSDPECCGANSLSKFCFSHEIQKVLSYSCLPVRSFVLNDLPCFSNEDCKTITKRVCVTPMTSESNRFLRISHVQGQDILFVGNPNELLVYVSVSDYYPKSNMIFLDIPDYIQTFLVYYTSLSAALAILNMIPCYCLDGQWALLAFMEYFLPRFLKSDSIRAIVYHLTLVLGSTLLLANVLYGLWNLRGEGFLSQISYRLNA